MTMLRSTVLGALLAAAINALLFLGFRAAGAFGPDVLATRMQAPITVGAVIGASVLGVAGAAVARALLGRFLREETARRVFLALAVVLLLATAATPFTGTTGAGAAEIAALELMHVVVAAVAVVTVERGRRRT